jgi:WD40 repeat protein
MHRSISRRKFLALGAITVAGARAGAAPENARQLAPVWTAETGRQVLVTRFSPDGKILASGGADGALRLWDLATGKLRKELPSNLCIEMVQGLAYTPDGKTLLSLSRGAVWLWDPLTLAPLGSLTPPEAGHATALALSPDGKTVAVGGSWGLRGFGFAAAPIWFFDLPGRELTETLAQPEGGGVVSLAFSPDGRRLSAGDQAGQACLWTLETRKREPAAPGKSPTPMKTIHLGAGPVWSVAYSPDGKLLATGGHNQAVDLWDAHTGEHLRTVGTHDHLVLSVAFSPDGKRLASGGYDKVLKLWEVRTGKAEDVRALDGWVHSVPFSADGRQLGSGDAAGKIRLWSVERVPVKPTA